MMRRSLVLLLVLDTALGFPIKPPAYHMVPVGWTNDPDVVHIPGNASTSDTWHNFYQATQDGSNNAPWAPGEVGVWRHASTQNWSTWIDHGIVSGTEGWGTGTIIVTHPGSPGAIARAYPGGPGIGIGVTNDTALLSDWADWPTSAVPPPTPPANSLIADPFLFYDAQRATWGMVVATCLGGSNFEDCVLPQVQLYSAPVLPPSNWTFVSDFFVGPESTGIRPECPRLWRFPAPAGGCSDSSTADVVLLIYSSTLQEHSLWFLGRVNASSSVFVPHASGVVDSGSFYAAHAFGGAGGWGNSELTIVGWLMELRPATPVDETPWFNLLSGPRATSLAPDCLRLSSAPAQWTEALRSAAPVWSGNVSVAAGAAPEALPAAVAATGTALWLDAEVLSWGSCSSPQSRNGSVGSWSLRVLASSGNITTEYTTITVSPSALVANLSASSLNQGVGRGVYTAVAAPTSPGFRGVTVLIDQNAVEVFGHSDITGEAVLSVFAYPAESDSTGVYVAAESDDVCLRLTAYSMPSSS